jgi:hypothetical protein
MSEVFSKYMKTEEKYFGPEFLRTPRLVLHEGVLGIVRSDDGLQHHDGARETLLTSWQLQLRAVVADVAAGRPADASARIVGMAALLRDIAPAVPTVQPYSRSVVYSDELGEILLMSWRSDAVSAIHDHGEAAGLVVALEGEFFEHTVTLPGCQPTGTRTLTAASLEPNRGEWRIQSESGYQPTAQRTSTLAVTAGDYHIMSAPNGGLSLHVYTPLPHSMRVVDPQHRTIWIVGQGQGAWLPVDPDLVKGQMPWPE